MKGLACTLMNYATYMPTTYKIKLVYVRGRLKKKIHIFILTLFCYKLVCKMALFCLYITVFLLVYFDIFTLNLALSLKNVEVGEYVNEFRKIKQRQSL